MVLFFLYFLIIVFAGRNTGRRLDRQYRRPEGKPSFTRIPDGKKWLFAFDYAIDTNVVREAFFVEILGYVFGILELLFLLTGTMIASPSLRLIIANGLLGLFLVLVCAIMCPMAVRYNRNWQITYDCDWITQWQEALALLPRRRCRIVAQVEAEIYEITLGPWHSKKHKARAVEPVMVGEKRYATHYYEKGIPYWRLERKVDE